MNTYKISIDRREVAKFLVCIIAGLMSASLLGQVSTYVFGHDHVYGLVPLFNVDEERNIPTFFTMLVALVNAILLAIIGLHARNEKNKGSVYWLALSFGFLFLAYDEGFQVHEKLMEPMRGLMGQGELGIFYFGWVIPGMVGVCILGLLFVKFLIQLPTITRRWMLIAGGLYLAGCIGMELIDGKYMELHGKTFVYAFLTIIEEALEMLGLATLVFALLGHIATTGERIELSFLSGEIKKSSHVTAVDTAA